MNNENSSETENKAINILIIVKGTIKQMVFIIALKPIRFDISIAIIKNSNIKITGELLK